MTDPVTTTLLDGLSAEARDVVTSQARQLLVVAGAGAGKTEAMARRIAWWHAIDAIDRNSIVAFTFTERAAEELKFRVRKYMAAVTPSGSDPSVGGMYVGTIHSFCINTLRKYWPRDFHNDDIVDDVARYALVQQGWFTLGLEALRDAMALGATYPPSRADTIEYFLNAYDLLNEYGELSVNMPPGPRPKFGRESEWCSQASLVSPVASDEVGTAFSRCAARYYAYLRCRHFLDFSTAQAELVERLEESTEKLHTLRETVTHLVVDEVQDVNVIQDRLRRLIVGDSGTLTAVGDHRQAIYAWRGGRIDLMASLATELDGAADGSVLSLSTNYRSTPRIIDISNQWNDTIATPAGMTSPHMRAGRTSRVDVSSTHIAIAEFPERVDEAEWIAQSIAKLVPAGTADGAEHDLGEGGRGLTYSDIAVLIRSSTDARTYQAALQGQGIPAVVKAGPDLFAQPEVLLLAGALSLTAQRTAFVGSRNNPRTLPSRVDHELGVTDADAASTIRAAFERLRQEGLQVENDSAARLIRASNAIASRLFDEERYQGRELRSANLLDFVRKPGDVRRVFPQQLFQMLLDEAGVSSWDDATPRGRTAMFHLGQMSTLITGIETPGWTSPSSYKHQITSLLFWATKQASPDEAPLLVSPDAVTVSTIHSAKGLQFAAIFVADVASRRFPSQMAKKAVKVPFSSELSASMRTDLLSDNDRYDSERRLLYVALTRAERYLFVSTSRPASASGKPAALSPFFRELTPLFDQAGASVFASPNERLPDVVYQPRVASNESRLVSSFSDLRYFLECPHDFYLRKVLGFTPTIDQAFGYGRGVHNLMREVHSNPASWAEDANDRSLLEARLQSLVDQGMFYLRHTTGTPAENMHRAGIRSVAEYIRTYSDELASLTFEPEREFEVLLPAENVLISGAIDVIRRDDPPRVTIIDFKSGDAKTDEHEGLDEEEMRLQVALYGVAARSELEYEPEKGLVRYLGEEDPERRQLDVPLDEPTIEASKTHVEFLARSIQRRDFSSGPADRPGTPPESRCRGCDFKAICGRSLVQR